ncbi:uncharacterized protein At4g15545-like isoform X2 [Abrus precatorius]|uniref:Uncharacterized protein At4g15545-like isoform X2 n=1 Tax=Abrus precatorius TaxID=3816 RepID=A0A8B8LBK7_ABRPR|nr:uncharacterized protein At4g15545-like isoform X2 [Abrus precatorius]
MLVIESSGSNVDLPEELVQVLPSDPYEQLDVARKITSIALSTRVNALQSESSALRAELADKNRLIAELQSQVESIDAALSEAADKLARADQDKESLLKEKASLSNTVRKLSRDVSKLEVFRRTLMQSLQEDEDNSPNITAKLQREASITSTSTLGDEEASLPPSRSSSMRINISDTGNYFAEDPARFRASHNLLLASQSSTPRITPPGSPPSFSASGSPTRTSKPVSPRRHSISFSNFRGMHDDRHGSMSSSDTGSQTGRTRVDGKEFFRQVRSRLSYEQFGAFLANVKELNSHKQTKEETLQKANEIFGPENKDLYAIFEGLITRNVH